MSFLVIGGSNHDVTLHLNQPLHAQSSNPVRHTAQWGGVARNVAEALGRLDCPVSLLTPLARTDAASLKSTLPPIDLHLIDVDLSPQYIEVMDTNGDLVYGFAAMEAFDRLQPQTIQPYESLIRAASVIVLDANFPQPVLEAVSSYGQGKLVADGTSVAKVKRLKPLLASLYILKLNEHEARALSGLSDPYHQVNYFQLQGVQKIFITTAEGVYTQMPTLRFVAQPDTVTVVSTTGAGDAFLAGLLYAEYYQDDPLSCAFAAARLALKSKTPIPHDLTVQRLNHERKTPNVKHP